MPQGERSDGCASVHHDRCSRHARMKIDPN
jgi:hypothetical protein